MACGIFPTILSLLAHVADEQQGPIEEFRWELNDGRLPTFVYELCSIWIRALAISFILWAYVCKPDTVKRISENTVVLMSMSICILHPLTNPLRGPLLLGKDPQDTWAAVSEIPAAEATFLAMVFSHIALVSAMPIRCSKLWVHHLVVAVSSVLLRSCFDSPFPDQVLTHNAIVAVVAGASFGNAYSSERSMRQSWASMRRSQNTAVGSQLELENQQAKTLAMRSLLSVLFDVVLQTGGDLTVTGDNVDLSSVLGEAHIDAGGAKLLDFVVPEERDRLLSFARDASALSVPQLLTTVFANSLGEHIPEVEVLIGDTRMDGEQKYLVGLRRPPLPLDNRADPLPLDCRDEARLRHGQERREARPGQGQREDCSERVLPAPSSMRQPEADTANITPVDNASSRPWRRMEVCGDADETADVFAVVDTMSTNFTITSCSDHFDTVCETSGVGQEFMAWLVDAENFGSWVEHQVNGLWNDSEREGGESPGMQVTLRPPAVLARGIEL